jgi:acetyl esterase/lipase
MGDSAGGGLSLALIMYLRDAGYQHLLPRGMVLMSPWVDLTMSCGSWDENAEFDVVPIPGQEGGSRGPGVRTEKVVDATLIFIGFLMTDHLNPVSCYLGPEGIKKYLTHPYASPLFGDFTGLPPMLVQA